ncbi:MAG: acryloyl-CoA reductase [Steroidobacteraceae bacterium]
MKTFHAFRINEHGAGIESMTLDQLSPGAVTIRVHWSDINYKDALAGTGKGRILRQFPLVGGVDLAGVVVASDDAAVTVGEEVLVTGCGLSETRDGGYAEYARVPADAVVKLAAGLSLRHAMAVGTAGFAAALAITQLEHNGLAPGQGPVAVTGASGGVGLVAIDMLARRGYEVTAFTRKAESFDLLRQVGAADVQQLDVASLGTRPLEAERWAGAIDNVGGVVASYLLRSARMQAGVASVGIAGGAELNVSLMPFLLRGVNLLGVNSSATKRDRRLAIWRRIAGDLAPRHLDAIVTRVVSLAELAPAFATLIAGSNTGRTLVRIHDDR